MRRRKSASCLLLVWPGMWPTPFCRPSGVVSANTHSRSRSCWPFSVGCARKTGPSEKPNCGCASLSSGVPCCACRACRTTPTVYRLVRRLPDATLDNVLRESVRRLRRSSRPERRRSCMAVDGTGLVQHAVSTYFMRRTERQASGKTRHKHFLKWPIAVDVDRQISLAQRQRQGPRYDTRALPGLVEAEFDSEACHRHVRGTRGAHSVNPAQSPARYPRRRISLPDARHFSAAALSAARQDGNRLFGDRTEALS